MTFKEKIAAEKAALEEQNKVNLTEDQVTSILKLLETTQVKSLIAPPLPEDPDQDPQNEHNLTIPEPDNL